MKYIQAMNGSHIPNNPVDSVGTPTYISLAVGNRNSMPLSNSSCLTPLISYSSQSSWRSWIHSVRAHSTASRKVQYLIFFLFCFVVNFSPVCPGKRRRTWIHCSRARPPSRPRNSVGICHMEVQCIFFLRFSFYVFPVLLRCSTLSSFLFEPDLFCEFLTLTRALQFEERPDYTSLAVPLRAALSSLSPPAVLNEANGAIRCDFCIVVRRFIYAYFSGSPVLAPRPAFGALLGPECFKGRTMGWLMRH